MACSGSSVGSAARANQRRFALAINVGSTDCGADRVQRHRRRGGRRVVDGDVPPLRVRRVGPRRRGIHGRRSAEAPPMATLPVGHTTVPVTMLPGPTLIAAGGVTTSTPERPAGPIGPGAPAAPVAPVAPCGPIGPAGPTEPSEPLQAEERRRERRVNVERKAGMRRVTTISREGRAGSATRFAPPHSKRPRRRETAGTRANWRRGGRWSDSPSG